MLLLLAVSTDWFVTRLLSQAVSAIQNGGDWVSSDFEHSPSENNQDKRWAWSSLTYQERSHIEFSSIVVKPVPKVFKLNPEMQSAMQLWQTWKSLWANSELQQIPIIGALLAKRLQHHAEPSIYEGIKSLLAQKKLAMENKALLLDLLADIATPEALSLLLELTDNGSESSLYFLVLAAIARIGDNRWDGQFHEELSPVLETAWESPETSDPALLVAIGTAIAKIGAPEGVNQLLLTVSGTDKDKQKQETERVKQEAAFNAIPQTRNPDAVPVLSEWFQQEELGTPAFEVSGDALAAIGTVEATQNIVNWAKFAPDEGARNLDAWLSQIDNETSLTALSETQKMSFQSPEVGSVVQKFSENPQHKPKQLNHKSGHKPDNDQQSSLVTLTYCYLKHLVG